MIQSYWTFKSILKHIHTLHIFMTSNFVPISFVALTYAFKQIFNGPGTLWAPCIYNTKSNQQCLQRYHLHSENPIFDTCSRKYVLYLNVRFSCGLSSVNHFRETVIIFIYLHNSFFHGKLHSKFSTIASLSLNMVLKSIYVWPFSCLYFLLSYKMFKQV